MQCCSVLAPRREDCALDKNVNALIRENDPKKQEEITRKAAAKNKQAQVGIEAKNFFHGGVGISALKYTLGNNHYEIGGNQQILDQLVVNDLSSVKKRIGAMQ